MKRIQVFFFCCSLLIVACGLHSEETDAESIVPEDTSSARAEALREINSRLGSLKTLFEDSERQMPNELIVALVSHHSALSQQAAELRSTSGKASRLLTEADFRKELGDYTSILSTAALPEHLKLKAWTNLCHRWGLQATGAPALLEWDDSANAPVVYHPPTLKLTMDDLATFRILPESEVIPSIGGLFFLQDAVAYTLVGELERHASRMVEFTADWEGIQEMKLDFDALRTVDLGSGVQLDLIHLEPGQFTMGGNRREEDERPRHEVVLSREFWMGQTEITQQQYEAVAGTNPSNFKGARLPVHNVSWLDARRFCALLTERARASGRLPEGYVYRLPTESEWEYACRAGTSTDYSGSNPAAMTWHVGNTNGAPQPVGTKRPNAWGLYDMHGSMWEWCLDGHAEYPEEKQVDPFRGPYEKIKITRGGGWTGHLKLCRTADRHSWLFGLNGIDMGFRVVLAPVVEDAPKL